MTRVISYIESAMWACRAQEFDALCRVAYRESDNLDAILEAAEFTSDGDSLKFDAMLAKKGERLNGTRYVEMRENGVAVIDVNGVIAKRMDFFTEVCRGGTSTETLLKDFQAALSSPNVSSIVFHIDSPGGEAFGVNEMAQAIFDARGRKPIKAYVSGLGCSGAYWIASACDEIICDKSAFLGSIGVVTSWTDDSGFYKALGIRREVITSTNALFKRLNLDIEEHRAELMRELDSLESVFHKAVARNRKLSVEQVKQDFNQGGVLSGLDAVKAKMADRTGSLEEVIKKLSRNGKQTASFGAENTEGEFEMGFKDEFKAFAVKHGLLTADDNEQKSETAAEAAADVNEPVAQPEAITAPPAIEQPKSAPAITEQQVAAFKESAEIFATSEIQAGRMSPREKEEFIELFAQSAQDDTLSPLASGSRLDRVKAQQKNRKSSLLTEETVNSETNQILLAQPGANSSDEKKQKLLSSTQLGKRTLELNK